jgi:PHD/YefM family antitoxin component YafN of YafNO toxin-antitoxin module
MIRGCLSNLFATIGCLTVICLGAVAAWYFRDDIAHAYHSVVERDRGGDSAPLAPGHPSAEALESAREKELAIARRDGPERVILSADEMASLIEDRLATEALQALDSIAVILDRDRFSLEADLQTELFGRDLLGPLRGMIDPREPIRLSGPAEVRAPGVIGWEIDEFQVASFPFPGPAIPVLVDRLTGGTGGVMLFAVPAEVDDLRIRPDGVTFYRRAN